MPFPAPQGAPNVAKEGHIFPPGTPQFYIQQASKAYNVPYWLLFGTAWAESSFGKGGANLFGLLDAAEGVNVSDWKAASMQAAKTYRGLYDQYKSWATAVQHYSGYSYTISHPKQLAEEHGVKTTTGEGFPGEAIVNDATGAVSDAVNAAGSVVDFVGEFVSTILNFRKFGELMAKVMAWFLRLIARAIYEYCIRPAWHWQERAVSYYFVNFFGKGAEEGSGFGYIYRANGGIITLVFWGLGYGILWTGPGSSFKPVDNPRETYLGRALKKVEGSVKKRKLVKPAQVKEKTPTKPEPKISTVQLQKTKAFSATRSRQVKVSPIGRNESVGNQRRGHGRGAAQTGSAENAETKIVPTKKTQKKPT